MSLFDSFMRIYTLIDMNLTRGFRVILTQFTNYCQYELKNAAMGTSCFVKFPRKTRLTLKMNLEGQKKG